MAKLVTINGGMLASYFRQRPPMGGLFPNQKQAEAWMKYYGLPGASEQVKVVLL